MCLNVCKDHDPGSFYLLFAFLLRPASAQGLCAQGFFSGSAQRTIYRVKEGTWVAARKTNALTPVLSSLNPT